MGITGIDHLYAETTRWNETIDFWKQLGFTVVEEWGSEGHRAGRLECNDARIVLAEISDGDPVLSVFFDLVDAEDVSDLPGVVTPLSNTHWGTRWIRVVDPEGRVHALEEHS